jgi:signal transduction histidine kinase/CheY-like chemotaxis protein
MGKTVGSDYEMAAPACKRAADTAQQHAYAANQRCLRRRRSGYSRPASGTVPQFTRGPVATLFSILRRHTLSIRTRLMMLTLATVLPLVAVGGFAVIRTVDDQTAQVEQGIGRTVDGLLGDIDRQIIAIEAELQVLAVSPSLQSEDLYPFYQQMYAALPLQGTVIVLLDTKGQQLLSTSRPFGAPLPRATNTEMHERVVATGKPQVSDLIMGSVLQRPVVVVGVPVFHDGNVAFVLVMGLGSEILSKLLRQPDLSPDWVVAIFDRKGIIVARNRELDRFLGKPAAPIIREAIAGPVDNWIPNVTSEGIRVYSTFRRSTVTGWTAAIGVPRGFVDAPRRRAQFLAFGGGGAVLALSLSLAWWMAQAIRRPVEALTAATKAVASGVPIIDVNGGVRELNQAGDALRATAAALARNQQELESIVAERTEQLRAEIEARKQAEATLLQSQKMEAIGQLTGGIAHDFNNLLTIASGSLEMLEARVSDERSLHLLQNAQSAISRGAKLTTSLLAFARKQRLEPVLANLNSVIIEMDEMVRRSLGPSVEIRHAFASELWPVQIDLSQIETALLNIAINARDAMPGGGILLFETANVSACPPEEMAGRDCVLVSVHDTGTGMSPDVMERAFEPFFTTKEVGRGTGLGLSMVFGVVHQSGGVVRLRSELARGTTVLIYLPRAAHAALPATGRDASAGVQSGAGAHILVVDDDAAVRWVTVECLRGAGYRVVEADSGRAALTLLKRDEPCDLVVMDHVMPGLSGQDTVRLARRGRPELKVLFLSGYATLGEAGGDIWLQKPFKTQALADAVSRALH